jgi:hypothetical protein
MPWPQLKSSDQFHQIVLLNVSARATVDSLTASASHLHYSVGSAGLPLPHPISPSVFHSTSRLDSAPAFPTSITILRPQPPKILHNEHRKLQELLQKPRSQPIPLLARRRPSTMLRRGRNLLEQWPVPAPARRRANNLLAKHLLQSGVG